VRVLFDHNLPHKLRTTLIALAGHEIVTTSHMGWAELRNGELLRVAQENGLDVFVTGDKSLIGEQNLTGRRLAIVVLSANNCPIIQHRVPRILAAIDAAVPGSFKGWTAAGSAGRSLPARETSVCCARSS
jgi:predicted nuclease of predicted toxin-antitoxin system